MHASVGERASAGRTGRSFDVVLLLGPLYHLVTAEDRLPRSARRRVSPGPAPPIAAAAIGRYARLLDFGAHAGLDETTEPTRRARRSQTGRHDPRLGFTTAYLHRPEELHAEFVAAGLADVDGLRRGRARGPALDAHGIDRIDEFLPAARALRADRGARPGADRRERAPARPATTP